MPRMQFRKTGNAVWISHLDLMRALQRAFWRAKIPLKHTQGFAPHPIFSIAMPLSVGVASECELAEFELDDPQLALQDMAARLNDALPKGIEILRCYEGGQALKHLKWLTAELTLLYDKNVPAEVAARIRSLFDCAELEVQKHGKNGPVTVDIRPMLAACAVEQVDRQTLCVRATVSAQNPTLNPLLLATAIETYLPADKPDFVKCRRLAITDEAGKPFE